MYRNRLKIVFNFYKQTGNDRKIFQTKKQKVLNFLKEQIGFYTFLNGEFDILPTSRIGLAQKQKQKNE